MCQNQKFSNSRFKKKNPSYFEKDYYNHKKIPTKSNKISPANDSTTTTMNQKQQKKIPGQISKAETKLPDRENEK